MIHITFTSVRATPDREGKRYVRAVVKGTEYAWCVQDAKDKRYDVQQGTCSADDLPADVRQAADDRQSYIPSYVDWPR